MRPTTAAVRARSPRRTLVVVGAVVAAGVCGCSALPLPGVGGPSTKSLSDGSVFLVAAPTSGGSEAIVGGRLTLIGGECIGVQETSGEGGDVLVFPHGSRSDDDGSAILLPDGQRITVGQSIWGSGGYTTLSYTPDAFERWPDAPPGCAQATNLATIYDITVGQRP